MHLTVYTLAARCAIEGFTVKLQVGDFHEGINFCLGMPICVQPNRKARQTLLQYYANESVSLTIWALGSNTCVNITWWL